MTDQAPQPDRDDDAPLADEGGPVPSDMPLGAEDKPPRPERTEEQRAEPRPDTGR